MRRALAGAASLLVLAACAAPAQRATVRLPGIAVRADYVPPGQVDGKVQPTTSQVTDPAAPKATVCVLGDSITDPRTWGSDNHDPTTVHTGPMPYLADDFHSVGANVTIWNFSVGGRSTVQGSPALPFLIRSIDCTYLVIEMGQNDDQSGFAARLGSLSDDVGTYSTAPGGTKVVLSFMWKPVPPAPSWQIAQADSKNGQVFVTLYWHWVSSNGTDRSLRPGVVGYVDAGQIDPNVCTTGIHLTYQAYARYAAMLYAPIAASMGLPAVPLPPCG